MNLIIKNGIIVDPFNNVENQKADIKIENNIIVQVSDSISPKKSEQVYDAKGCYVTPGLLDMHGHLREPGREDKEKISTGTRSAAMGGFTEIAAMPNTIPPIDNVTGLKFVQMLAEKEGVVHVHPIAAITKGQKGETLTEMGDLFEQGAVAFSDDGYSVQNAELMRRALEYSKMFNVPIIEHAEDKNLAEGGMINEGSVSTLTGLKGIPSVAEDAIIARDLLLAEYTQAKLHIAHISTKKSVELIREAKKKGVSVTCEVTGHHFSLNEELLSSFDSNLKMNPPLRSQEDVEALIDGLKDGTIDAIVSDHAPHTIFEKEREFDYAPFGIIGFETLVPLTFTNLVHTKKLSVYEVITRFTKNPYAILNLSSQGLVKDAIANISVINPDLELKYNKEDIVSKSCNSPFIGKTFKGWPVLTVVEGKVIMQDRKILV